MKPTVLSCSPVNYVSLTVNLWLNSTNATPFGGGGRTASIFPAVVVFCEQLPAVISDIAPQSKPPSKIPASFQVAVAFKAIPNPRAE
jgi:hypothetical protein